MKQKRHTDEQIIGFLKAHEADQSERLGQGAWIL